MSLASFASPIRMGMMGCSPGTNLKPAASNPILKRTLFSRNRRRNSSPSSTNSNALSDAAAKAGEIVNVFTHDKKFIGKGYINPQSQIMVRLLTRDKDEAIDEKFFYNGIKILKMYCSGIFDTIN